MIQKFVLICIKCKYHTLKLFFIEKAKDKGTLLEQKGRTYSGNVDVHFDGKDEHLGCGEVILV
jgi:hypothetical protein